MYVKGGTVIFYIRYGTYVPVPTILKSYIFTGYHPVIVLGLSGCNMVVWRKHK
jgi:hypothetical protein